MSEAMFDRLKPIVGADAASRAAGGSVRVTPPTTDAVAGVLGVAHNEGWRVLIEGAGSWRTDEPPADVIMSLRDLDEIREVQPGGLVATAGAGVAIDLLRREVLEHGVWLPLDPPGRSDRTLGSVVATATAGPLRRLFGPVRNRVLGVTVVTGDGRVVRTEDASPQPRLAQDPVKLHVGGFGAFGAITECRLELDRLPRADLTWVTEADRDYLTATARDLEDHTIGAAAVELFSPALAARGRWLLAVRILGPVDHVAAEGQRLAESTTSRWKALDVAEAQLLWSGTARALTSVPVSLRLAVLAEGIDDALDLVSERLGEGMMSTGLVSGLLRWSGVADADTLRALRVELAAREIPLTLERAPWRVRRAVGHFGPYREGNGGIVNRNLELFDPGHVLVSAIDAETIE